MGSTETALTPRLPTHPDAVAEVAAPPDDAVIVERIHDAVLEQRLPPGTKLSEAALCEAFGVRRARIRRSLLILASRNIVELQANRGAFVSRPTPAEARDIFEARRATEDTVARLAAARAEPAAIDRLAAHLAAEERAHGAHDRPRAIRLSGEFHSMLAQASGNAVFHRIVKELVARTSLIIGMFGSVAVETCRPAEHDELLAALRSRDAEGAARVMRHHLLHIEAALDLGRTRRDGVDVVSLFSN